MSTNSDGITDSLYAGSSLFIDNQKVKKVKNDTCDVGMMVWV